MEERQIIFTSEKIKEIQERLDNGYVIPRHEKYWFKDMPLVKKTNLTFSFTDEEYVEYLRCKMGHWDGETGVFTPGIEYFSENYCYIKSEDGSIKPLRLRDYQKEILDLYATNRFSILNGSRQIGKCVTMTTDIIVDGRTIPMFKLWFKTLTNKTVFDYVKYGIYRALYYLERD